MILGMANGELTYVPIGGLVCVGCTLLECLTGVEVEFVEA
jgi:hypothetical protein